MTRRNDVSGANGGPAVEGSVARGWEDLLEAFRRGQTDDPGGAQLCVYFHGEMVADLWCGRDVVNDRPFTAQTTTLLFSASKGPVSTAAHRLVQRGLLDLEAPVAEYWPAFATAGKSALPLSQILSHQAGLMTFPRDSGIVALELLDWNRCVEALAGMAPLWKPGSAFRYHPLTFGYLVGEVVRLLDGRSLGQIVAEDFRGPLGLRMWLGDMPASEEHHFAPAFVADPAPGNAAPLMDAVTAERLDPEEPLVQAALAGAAADPRMAAAFLNTPQARAAEIPAANMISNAQALARFYAAHLDMIDGVRLLGAAQVDAARTPQTDDLGQPPPLDRLPVVLPLRFGLGWELDRPTVPMVGPGSFGHTGAGGKFACADPESGIAVAYVANNMAWNYAEGSDRRWRPWLSVLRAKAALSARG